MKVMVTGMLGFVGSHLAQKLVDEGYKVYGVVRRVANRNLDAIKGIMEDVTLVSGDITDFVSVRNAFKTVSPTSLCTWRRFHLLEIRLSGLLSINKRIFWER
jgi:nucleoside-diphosphate-sugar epimerase